MESLQELKQFLKTTARLDLKAVSLTYILELTGSDDGRKLIKSSTDVLTSILQLTQDESATVAKDAALSLVNISADEEGAQLLLKNFSSNEYNTGIIQLCIKMILNEECVTADIWCMIICNLSRPEFLVEIVIREISGMEEDLDRLCSSFTKIGYNKKANLDYIGPLFSNLSQSSTGRELICNKSRRLLQRMLPFTHHQESVIRRGGAIGLLKNVCFDSSIHEWLLSSEVEVLPYILLPLAGPEEYDDDDNDKFPIELQYLGPEKTREIDPDLRKMLLESLAQLCATKQARVYLRLKGTYEILRELHKWEVSVGQNKQTLLACENVVDILIRTEDEIGEDNLKELEIPDDIATKIVTLTEQEAVAE